MLLYSWLLRREVWLMQQLSGQGTLTGLNVFEWADNPEFASNRRLSENPNTTATMFLPGPVEAFRRQAEAQCLTLQEWVNEIAKDPKKGAQYVRSYFVPSAAWNSSAFYDGLTLKTFQSGTSGTLVLGRREM